MIYSNDWKFADRIFVVPVKSSHMKSFALSRCGSPNTSNCACSLDKFWYQVDSSEFPGMNSRSLSDSVDFLIIPLVGVLFGDHDVEVEDSATESVDSLSEFMSYEFGHFGLINEQLFELIEVVIVEDLDNFLQFRFEKQSIGFAHLMGSTLEIGNVKIVFLWIIQRSNQEFLSVSYTAQKPGFLIDQSQVVELYVDGEDSGQEEKGKEIFNHVINLCNNPFV